MYAIDPAIQPRRDFDAPVRRTSPVPPTPALDLPAAWGGVRDVTGASTVRDIAPDAEEKEDEREAEGAR